jgi:hypothetical protein
VLDRTKLNGGRRVWHRCIVALPDKVHEVVDSYLALVEQRLPGRVAGLYLHGSLGFGEWYDGRSDIDFVAVIADRPDPATTSVLQDVHDRVGEACPRPFFSGLYVTWDDLARPPFGVTGLYGILEGNWSDHHGPDPVTWHELAHHGVHVHGPMLDDVSIHTDVHALRTYSQGNLADYWQPRLGQLTQRPELACRPDLLQWFVLGIPRLHHAIATGSLTSKDGAGHYALEVFGQHWLPVVGEALTYRARGEPSGTWAGRDDDLAREVIAFCTLALEAGLNLDPINDPD